MKDLLHIRDVHYHTILYLERRILLTTHFEMQERKKIIKTINDAKEVLYNKEDRLFNLKYVCRNMENKKTQKEIELEQVERQIIKIQTSTEKSIKNTFYGELFGS